ncbi:MAG: ATP-binding protein, partial [Treponema sp.]|nr:ATP-binding protein [Treponema sp.]
MGPDLILKIRADIAGLSVFSSLREHPLFRSLENLLGALSSKALPLDVVRGWARFTEALALPRRVDFPPRDRFDSFYSRIAFLAATADNDFTRQLEAADPDRLPPAFLTLAENDLSRLGRIAGLDLRSLGAYAAGLIAGAGLGEGAAALEKEARALADGAFPEDGALEGLFSGNAGWGAALSKLGAYIRAHGAGALGLYNSFSWSPGAEDSPLRPALNPDPIRLGDLSGYEDQRSVVTANTLRFLEGKGANNLLLYGDRGTGKSATVKAVCNEYASRGLRLLEVRKGDLPELPLILDLLASRALRFVLFIDDLSFESADDSFTGLKALLEGRVESLPGNVVIYATSNRRHLVRERLSDRPGLAEAAGEVRAFDALQEQFSLADRFGITVVYAAPNQEEYLRIACFIGRRRGVLGTGEEEQRSFRDNALRWERWFNGRSPRTAAQYVEWVAGGT